MSPPSRWTQSFCLALAALALAGCASWKPQLAREAWTLHAQRTLADEELQRYEGATAPAFAAVSERFGAFRRPVSLYLWEDSDARVLGSSNSSQIHETGLGAVQEVPGIGLARVRAFHSRTNTFFGPRSGIYLGAPEAGTVAHEFVHARMADEGLELPLWLEEGLANFVGDGYLDGDRWVVDGLACWPMRELAEARISDRELASLLALTAEDASDARENVLAHFVGWAIVFDLQREEGGLRWREWTARYSNGIAPSEARMRMERTLAPATLEAWMKRLADPAPSVRIATAKGVWKLRSLVAVEALIDQLEVEKDPLARVALAINLLASAGEMRLPESLQRRMWRLAWPTMRRAKLADPREQKAVDELFASFRWGSRGSASGPLEVLRRYWAE